MWRLFFTTALAVIGQLAIMGGSLTLAREESSAVSHVERNGIALHHGHNEATCVSCATLSLHATVNSAASISPAEISSLAVCIPQADRLTDPQLLPNSCRAPPREV